MGKNKLYYVYAIFSLIVLVWEFLVSPTVSAITGGNFALFFTSLFGSFATVLVLVVLIANLLGFFLIKGNQSKVTKNAYLILSCASVIIVASDALVNLFSMIAYRFTTLRLLTLIIYAAIVALYIVFSSVIPTVISAIKAELPKKEREQKVDIDTTNEK